MEQRQRFATFCVSNGAEDELREGERKRGRMRVNGCE